MAQESMMVDAEAESLVLNFLKDRDGNKKEICQSHAIPAKQFDRVVSKLIQAGRVRKVGEVFYPDTKRWGVVYAYIPSCPDIGSSLWLMWGGWLQYPVAPGIKPRVFHGWEAAKA